MKMNKKVLGIGLIGVMILVGIIFLALRSEKETSKNQNIEKMIYFYGKECSHCKNVEKFLAENINIEERVKFEKLEVWKNFENRELLGEIAKKCDLSPESIGVPFFWDGNNCVIGDVDIIELLKNKAKN